MYGCRIQYHFALKVVLDSTAICPRQICLDFSNDIAALHLAADASVPASSILLNEDLYNAAVSWLAVDVDSPARALMDLGRNYHLP